MVFVSAILAIGMICFAFIKKGEALDSISSIAYIIPKWLFSAWTMLIGITLMPPLMDTLSINNQWVGFLMVLGLSCVAASPYYKDDQATLHYVGAIICFVFAVIVVSLVKPYMLMLWCLYPFTLFGRAKKYWVLVAEWICLSTIFLTII